MNNNSKDGINNKEELIKYWLEKSDESLESAKVSYKNQAFNSAINRIYYSAFYAVSALLLYKIDRTFRKHTGVRTFFHKEIIKENIIEEKWGKYYDQIFEDRIDGDYTPFVDFEKDYVKDMIERCEKFQSKIKSIITL